MQSLRSIIAWLGPVRARAIFILLAITGFASLALNVVQPQPEWVRSVQTGLVIAFLVGAAGIILSRVPAESRRPLLLMSVPALTAIILALLMPQYSLFFVPLGIGALFFGAFLIRGRTRQEYQAAIKHMRNEDFDAAVEVISEVVQKEPENADHRRFRAELYRLAGKIKKARTDYEKVIELTPESPVGYNGLAEVYLQDGEFEKALGYAKKALEMEPDYWIAPYNLGMIEDRLGMAADAVQHLEQALKAGIPESRHRLLTNLWIARAYARQNKANDADTYLDKMRHERTGLNEWETIFESKAAAVLRSVLESDVQLAARLVNGEADVQALRGMA